MTEFFQSALGTGWGWFVANLILILLIALPVMLAVELRSPWAACSTASLRPW